MKRGVPLAGDKEVKAFLEGVEFMDKVIRTFVHVLYYEVNISMK